MKIHNKMFINIPRISTPMTTDYELYYRFASFLNITLDKKFATTSAEERRKLLHDSIDGTALATFGKKKNCAEVVALSSVSRIGFPNQCNNATVPDQQTCNKSTPQDQIVAKFHYSISISTLLNLAMRTEFPISPNGSVNSRPSMA